MLDPITFMSIMAALGGATAGGGAAATGTAATGAGLGSIVPTLGAGATAGGGMDAVMKLLGKGTYAPDVASPLAPSEAFGNYAGGAASLMSSGGGLLETLSNLRSAGLSRSLGRAQKRAIKAQTAQIKARTKGTKAGNRLLGDFMGIEV